MDMKQRFTEIEQGLVKKKRVAFIKASISFVHEYVADADIKQKHFHMLQRFQSSLQSFLLFFVKKRLCFYQIRKKKPFSILTIQHCEKMK